MSCNVLDPEVLFLLTPVLCLYLFLEPQFQLAINRSLPTPAQRKALRTNESVKKAFANSWMFYQEALPEV